MPALRATLEDPDYRAFVSHIIWLRKKAKVTQVQLAARMDRPQSYISKTERFQRRIDPAEFTALVQAIGGDPVSEFAAVVALLNEERLLSTHSRPEAEVPLPSEDDDDLYVEVVKLPSK